MFSVSFILKVPKCNPPFSTMSYIQIKCESGYFVVFTTLPSPSWREIGRIAERPGVCERDLHWGSDSEWGSE